MMSALRALPILLLSLSACQSTCAHETSSTEAATPRAEGTTAAGEQKKRNKTALPISKVTLPKGFQLSVFAEGIPHARSLARGDKGTIFVGNFSMRDSDADKVYALSDRDGDQHADTITVIASGLNQPNGVAFHNGNLYVAEINRVLRFKNIESHLENPPTPEAISTAYPDDLHHGWKYLRVGPDEKLYVPVGVPCNVCLNQNPIFGTITRLNLDGSGLEIFAKGIRNSVGFDWHPRSKELWFTDNGRDHLGDDRPPDELNHAPNKNMHFGFPFCHGGTIVDPEFGAGKSCGDYTPPVQNLGPHVASLGMRFYTGEMFPPEYKDQIFIAEHGSWNRSKKIGYRISLVRLEANKALSYTTFASGWLDEESQEVWGRPVDLLVMPDGALLISDDYAGAVYRISFRLPIAVSALSSQAGFP